MSANRQVLGHTASSFSVGLKVSAGSLVFVSGLLPTDSQGKLVAKDMESQVRQIFETMSGLMTEAGGSLTNVVKLTAYMTTLQDYAVYAKLRGDFFAGSFPASAVVQVVGLVLPGALVEVDAFAVLP
jgi:enamine deaminase RidA (YjgF/YER057c/UK114 family)